MIRLHFCMYSGPYLVITSPCLTRLTRLIKRVRAAVKQS